MELKRPFSIIDWLDTPPAVQQYIIALEQGFNKLVQQDKELEKRIEKLENRLNQNSKNSNKPPSSDPPFTKGQAKDAQKPENKDESQVKNPEKKKPEKIKRKRGAQKGHKGHKQELLEPTQVIPLKPERCSCGCQEFDERSMKPIYIHQQIELPEIKMNVNHIMLYKGPCLNCGKIVKAMLPKKYQPGYGPRLTALIAELSGILGDARKPVQTFCRSVFGFHISVGAIQKVIDRASEAIAPIYDELGRQARRAPVNNIDETSFFQNGKLRWLWVMANPSVSFYMIHTNRSKQAFEELIRDWNGALVSDNYGVYRKWLQPRQSCLAHLPEFSIRPCN